MKGFRMTIDDLVRLKNEGKIRGFHVGPSKVSPESAKLFIDKKTSTKTRENVFTEILDLCREYEVEAVQEYKFHPKRKWRFDIAAPSIKVAFEFEGIMSDKSRHTNVVGYSKDAVKYANAQQLGWIVLRFTVINKDEMLETAKQVIKTRLI